MQEQEQIRLRRPRFGMRGLDPRVLPKRQHGFAFHLQVRRDVSISYGDARVPEIIADRHHVD